MESLYGLIQTYKPETFPEQQEASQPLQKGTH